MSIVEPYSELTSQQRTIIEESSGRDTSYWIEGPPGSGKTTISLHIVNMLTGEKVVNPLVLIFNHSLRSYLESSFEQLGLTDSVTIATKDKFFWNMAGEKGIKPDHKKTYDEKYKELLSGLLSTEFEKTYSVVILDEIQDFRKDEWAILKKIGSKFIVLGDFDQGIYRSDLHSNDLSPLCENRSLTTIFRFGKRIAALLNPFSTSGKSLDDKVSSIQDIEPILLDVEQNEVHQKVAEFIKARQSDGGRIGVISISRYRLKKLHEYLDNNGIEHIHAPVTSVFKTHDFSKNTPVLITSASVKGLEFETVIAFGFEKDDKAIHGFRNGGGLNENIYVCLSRAKEYLYLIRTPDTIQELKSLEVENGSQETDTDDGDDDDWF